MRSHTPPFRVEALEDRLAPSVAPARQFAAGADRGSGTATLYNQDQSVRFSTTPFGGFTGGVRTAAADFTGDGVAELVVGTGPGTATLVRVIDPTAPEDDVFSVAPFEAAFTGGVYVAVGDTTGDGVPELVITPDEGGGPRVRAFNGKGFAQLADFFGIDDPNFRGGARAAVGDVNGDGFDDVVVAAGFQGGPRVATFSGIALANSRVKLFNDFFAFEQTLRNGVFVAVGDENGDGFGDIIAGGGPGGGPRVSVFCATCLINSGGGNLNRLADFFAGDPNNRGGIRVATKDLDGDQFPDFVVGAGAGAGSRVTGYRAAEVPASGTPPTNFAFDAFPGFSGGVFVG